MNKFTLVQWDTGISDEKPTVTAWSPAAAEQPALLATKILGVTMTDATDGEPVAVMKHGYLRDCPAQNGETWANGEDLWAKSDGTITHTRPAGPLPQVYVGYIFGTTGGGDFIIDVDVRIIPSMGELSGVSRETPVDKDVFIYNTGTDVWEPRQIDHGADLVPASLLDNDHPLYQRKHGFELSSAGAASMTITYDKTTRKITLTPVSSTFRFWIDGVQYIKTGAQVSGAHANTIGKHFFYYDANGDLQVSMTPWSVRNRAVTPVALVYWSTTMADGVCFYEGHTADRTLEQHYHDHFSQGTQFISGAALSGYTLTTDTTAAVTFGIASTVIADEDIVHTLTALADGGPYMTLWRSGASGEWIFNDTRTLPWEYDAGADYIAYNNPNAGGAGVWGLTSIGGGNFTAYYVVAVPSVQSARQFVLLPSQAVYGTLALAQLATLQSYSWGDIPFEEVVPLYRIIYRTGASYATSGRGRIEQIDTIAGSVLASLPGSPSIHNSLSGRSDPNTHPASSITFTPYSTIAATTVQAAIEELLDEGAGSLALDDLTDVNAPTPGDGEVLTWDSTPGEWVAATATATVATLDAVGDVDVPTPSPNDVLMWDGADWVNNPTAVPSFHAVQHQTGGGDPIKLDDLAAPDDNTDLNATTGVHGLLKKLSNVATEYMDGTGNWSVPPGGAAALDDLTDVNAPTPSVGDVLTWDDTPGEWVAQAPTGGVAALDDVGDVNAPTPGDGDVLTWDDGAGEWVASAAGGGGGPMTLTQRFVIMNPAEGTQEYPLFLANKAGTITRVSATKIGTGTLTVDALINATEIGSDVTPGTAPTWASQTNSDAFVADDEISVVLKSVSGTVSYLVVQVDYAQDED